MTTPTPPPTPLTLTDVDGDDLLIEPAPRGCGCLLIRCSAPAGVAVDAGAAARLVAYLTEYTNSATSCQGGTQAQATVTTTPEDRSRQGLAVVDSEGDTLKISRGADGSVWLHGPALHFPTAVNLPATQAQRLTDYLTASRQ